MHKMYYDHQNHYLKACYSLTLLIEPISCFFSITDHDMHIWVDADACPNSVKEILFRAAIRTGTPVTLVANQSVKTPPSPFIKAIQVGAGFDVADNYIVQQLKPNDIVITADIPLAAEVVDKGAQGINPRGTLYTAQNIKQALTMRNFMEEMRSTGQASGGPPPLDSRDKQAFANTLDRLLAKHRKALQSN